MKVWLAILAFFLFATELKAMSIFDAGKACTFSSISGVILKNGQPVKQAHIKRETDYQSVYSDETTTDENGHFALPPLFERSISNLLPQEFVVSQKITVTTKEGETHVIWDGIKRKKEENAESDGNPIVVSCELNAENKTIFTQDQPFTTKCEWNVTPTKLRTGFNR